MWAVETVMFRRALDGAFMQVNEKQGYLFYDPQGEVRQAVEREPLHSEETQAPRLEDLI